MRPLGFVALLVTREESETRPDKPGKLQAAVELQAAGIGAVLSPRLDQASNLISESASAAALAAASAVNSAVETAGLAIPTPVHEARRSRRIVGSATHTPPCLGLGLATAHGWSLSASRAV